MLNRVILALLCVFEVLLAHAPEPATLNIQIQKPVGKVSPTLYGLMTEEINYSYDGGLYAELVRNRTFHAGWAEPSTGISCSTATRAPPCTWTSRPDPVRIGC